MSTFTDKIAGAAAATAAGYVLEQDTILTEEPRGEGPVADVRDSAGYLRQLLAADR